MRHRKRIERNTCCSTCVLFSLSLKRHTHNLSVYFDHHSKKKKCEKSKAKTCSQRSSTEEKREMAQVYPSFNVYPCLFDSKHRVNEINMKILHQEDAKDDDYERERGMMMMMNHLHLQSFLRLLVFFLPVIVIPVTAILPVFLSRVDDITMN